MVLLSPKKQFKHVLQSQSPRGKRAKANTLSVFESQPPETENYDVTDTQTKNCTCSQIVHATPLVSSCADGPLSMIGKATGAVALLGRFLGRPLLKYHYIIHLESLCRKVVNLQHVMVPVAKCVNKIRARESNRTQLREYCVLLDEEYGGHILHCEVCWLSRGQVLKLFWIMKHIVHDFLEERFTGTISTQVFSAITEQR